MAWIITFHTIFWLVFLNLECKALEASPKKSPWWGQITYSELWRNCNHKAKKIIFETTTGADKIVNGLSQTSFLELSLGTDLQKFEDVWSPRCLLEIWWFLARFGSWGLLCASCFGSWLPDCWSGVPWAVKPGGCKNKISDLEGATDADKSKIGS